MVSGMFAEREGEGVKLYLGVFKELATMDGTILRPTGSTIGLWVGERSGVGLL